MRDQSVKLFFTAFIARSCRLLQSTISARERISPMGVCSGCGILQSEGRGLVSKQVY